MYKENYNSDVKLVFITFLILLTFQIYSVENTQLEQSSKGAIDDHRSVTELSLEGDASPAINPSNESTKSNAGQQQFIHQVDPVIRTNHSIMITQRQRSRNYASVECAKVVENNPEAKKASHIINEMIDEYMLNPCKANIWFVIELCDSIQATHVEIANYELFSSTFKDFTVYFSDVHPALDWKNIGQFTATDSRTLQTFDLNQVGFGKFIKIELHSHYGNEHYCPISEVKVYGNSMVDEYEKSENLNGDLGNGGPLNALEKSRKPKRRTSAYRVYYNVMTARKTCGLFQRPAIDDKDVKGRVSSFFPKKEHIKPSNSILPPSNQQTVVTNRTISLKPSIFVELSNKVKALEISVSSLRTQNEEIGRKLNQTEVEMENFTRRLKSIVHITVVIVISYLVYKTMVDLM